MTMTSPERRESEQTAAFRLEERGNTAVLWFDLPGEKVNKFSSAVLVELDRILDEIGRRSDLEGLVIASAKEGIFIAGADIEEFTKVTTEAEAEEFTRYGQHVFSKLEALPQFTVAAINGACMGGGTELSLACDLRIMADTPKARIALPEVKLGIFPAWGGTTRLPRLVGLPPALDMILTGKSLDARRAKKIGLVDEVVDLPVLVDVAVRLAARRERPRRKGSRLLVEGNPLARKMIFSKARKSVVEKTGGHYPAPLKAIDVMEIGFREGTEKGFAAEAREVASLIGDPVAQNLVRLFFLMEQSKHGPAGVVRPIESTAVLGAGLMGAGIAHAIADKAGVSVRLRDISWDALASGFRSIAKLWRRKVERRRMKKGEMDRKLALVTPTTDWSGFSGVDLVVEAVVEKLAIKQQVLREIEQVAPGAIFATNTSTIPITEIARAAERPERVVGMHFFSPVDKMPLLEVIAGESTSADTLATAAAFGRKLGKTVVVVRDGPGFIVNRILGPYMNEAGFLLRDGNSIESIDAAMVSFGMPLGPLALIDEVGIDVAAKAGEVLAAAFGERLESSGLVEKLVEAERYGKKSGRGVYRWKNGKRESPDSSVYDLMGVASTSSGDRDEMQERMILPMINEAALILDEGIASSAADVDVAMIFGTGFPPFRGGLLRWADSLGAGYVVARLDELTERYGKRFVPTEPLRRLAESERGFYEAWPRRS